MTQRGRRNTTRTSNARARASAHARGQRTTNRQQTTKQTNEKNKQKWERYKKQVKRKGGGQIPPHPFTNVFMVEERSPLNRIIIFQLLNKP